MRRIVSASLLILALSLAGPAAAATQDDPIAAGKELYASAAYDEALTALRAARDQGGSEVARLADQYIAFCLLALGKNSEAEIAAESAVRRDPLASIDLRDASPRIEALFTQVRKRLLPGLIRDGYRSARETMNQGDTAKGMDELAHVRLMLDAAKTLSAWDDTLGDIAVLVDGFLDLTRATAAQRPAAPPPAAAPTAATAPPSLPPVVGSQPALSAKPAPTTYDASNPDVTPPVVIRQDIPEVRLDSPTRATKRTGVIAVVVDESGNVRGAVMRESISTAIDAQLLKAARSWQYRPAMKGGVPVPYLKVIGIAIGN
jgi:hypothetical protein